MIEPGANRRYSNGRSESVPVEPVTGAFEKMLSFITLTEKRLMYA